jgi:SAM-dependent methyltransferase
MEIRLASNLTARGVTGFVIDCVDVNAQMLERGRSAAAAQRISGQLNLIQADLNSWIPETQYDVVLSNQALHHIVNLEGLFSHIERSLAAGGRFVIIDTIGRNGHLRWPEALGLVREFWRKLPPSYRYNLLLDRYEEMFEDWDCSQDGFEGVRSQDILPLLVERFPFQLFVGYGNLLDPFVDRSFGHHFNAEAEWDRDFIDQVHRRNEQGLATGELKPTQMAAIVAKQGNGTASPARYVRDPDLAVQCTPAIEQSPYEWQQAWPDQCELLGARIKACDLRIREHQRREGEAAAAIEGLAKESADRAGWAMRLSRELEERSAWAHSLKRELDQRTALCSALESQSGERTAWALRLDREVEQSSALVERLRADLDARTRWARELERTLAERTAWAAQLQAELDSSRSAARGGWMRRALRKLRS